MFYKKLYVQMFISLCGFIVKKKKTYSVEFAKQPQSLVSSNSSF